jgi:hypothetical protein
MTHLANAEHTFKKPEIALVCFCRSRNDIAIPSSLLVQSVTPAQ